MNIQEFTDKLDNSIHIIITHEDGSTTSMPKAVWDELEAAKKASGTL